MTSSPVVFAMVASWPGVVCLAAALALTVRALKPAGVSVLRASWNWSFAAAMLALIAMVAPQAKAQAVASGNFVTTVVANSTAYGETSGVTVDGAGNVYFSSDNKTSIWRATLQNGLYSATPVVTLPGVAYGITVDTAGNLYAALSGGSVIRYTLSNGSYGAAATVATGLGTLWQVAVDPNTGTIYTVSYSLNRVYSITPKAGGGYNAPVIFVTGLLTPEGVTVDGAGNVYVADTGNKRVLKETNNSGSFTQSILPLSASLAPVTLSVDGKGNLFLLNSGTTSTSVIEEVLSGSTYTPVQLSAVNSTQVYAIVVDRSGNLYYPDYAGNAFRYQTTSSTDFGGVQVGATPGSLSVNFAVTTAGTFGATRVLTQGAIRPDFALGTGSTCSGSLAVNQICTVNVNFNPQAPGLRLGAIELTNSSGLVLATTLLEGVGQAPLASVAPGTLSTRVLGVGAALGVAVDASGNFYVPDSGSHVVRKITPAGVATIVAGKASSPGATGDGGPATAALLNSPSAVAVDGAGNLFIADTKNNKIRMVTAATGLISVVAGTGTAGYAGDGGVPTSAALNAPQGVSVDGAGDVFIADTGNNRIREVNPVSHTILTVAGNGVAGYSGDSGTASGAELSSPVSVAIDSANNLYIVDQNNNAIRKVTTSSAVISTVAGNGSSGFTGDAGPATQAELATPSGVAVDAGGNLYIADSANKRVRMVSAVSGTILTIGGNGKSTPSGDGGAATAGALQSPTGIALDSTGNLYVSDPSSQSIREISASAGPVAFATTPIFATSTDSPAMETLTNMGNQPLAFTIPDSGLNPSITSDFYLDNGSTCPQLSTSSTAATLAAGTSCTAEIDFTPQELGALTGKLTIADNSMVVAAAQQTVSLSGTALQAPQSITLAPIAGPVTYGVAPIALSATGGGSGNPVTFSVLSGPGAISGNVLTVLAAGGITIAADQAGNTNYLAAPEATQVLVVNPAVKTLTFDNLNSPVAAGSSQTLNANASNGDAVTFAITSGVASIAGNVATFDTAGTVTVQAESAATAQYSAAMPLSQTITVLPAPSSYAAPTTVVGATSAIQTATVNFSRSASLGAIAVVTQGAAGKDFNVAPGGTCAIGVTYVARQVCTVNFAFSPVSPGARQGAVVLKDASGNVLGTSYLGGTGTGPLGLFTTATHTLGIGGLNVVRGISLDGYGNIYGFQTGTGEVDKFAAGSPSKTQLAILASSNSGGATAVDGAGNVFLSHTNAGALYEFVGGTGPAVRVATVPPGDDNLEIDGAGNLYLSGYNNGAIYEISAGTYQLTTRIPGGIGRRFVGMAVDAAGNIFAGDFNNNILYEVPAGTSNLVTLASGGYLSNPHGVAVDPAGNIYVSNYNGSTVIRYAAGTHAATLLPAAGQRGIALDGAGNLYTITNDATIAVYTRTVATPFTFADTTVGTTGNSQQGVVFENDGNADLIITGYSATAPFALTGSQNTCATGTLTSGGSCVVGASFSPALAGLASGTATIVDNTLGIEGTAQTISLSGTATAQHPTVAVSAATIAYLTDQANLSASVSFVGSTAPTGAVSFRIDSGASVTATCSGTASPLSCTAVYPTGTLPVPTHSITATIAADSNFTAASGTATLTVSPIAPAITFAVPSRTYGDAAVSLAATSSSNGAFTYSVVSGPATISGNLLTITGAGSVTLQASQAANGNYTAGSQNASFAVAQAQLGVAIAGTPSKTYDGTTTAVLTASNFSVTGLVGSDSITVNQTAGNYAAANAGAENVTAPLSTANFAVVKGVLNNYILPASAQGPGFINRASATVTPNGATKVYGQADPALTGTLNGFVAGDAVTAAYTRAAGETVLGGPYAISATLSPAAVLANYAITYNTASLTITPAPASVTPNASSKVYGAADPALTGTLTGFLPADNVSAVYNRVEGQSVLGGPYAITAVLSPAQMLSNYSVTYHSAQLTISPAPASVTPSAMSKMYGSADPALTGTLTGFLAGDNVTATYTRAAGETVPGGPYGISASLGPAGVLSNYSVTYNTAQFTVTPAPLSVTAASTARTYGAANPAFMGTITGIVNNDPISASYATEATSASGVGTYAIVPTLSGATLANYIVTVNNGELTVNPATLVVTANNATTSYGTAAASFTGTISGIVNQDAITAAYTANATAASPVGSYTIVPTLSGAALPNYTVTTNDGVLTVSPAALTVAATNATRSYGVADPAFTGSISGIMNNDAITAAYAANATTASPVGPYAIVPTLSGAALSNYTVNASNGVLTVTAAPLVVAANNASRGYGAANPAFTGTMSGILNNDAITVTYSSDANAQSPVGSYSIVPALSGSALSNYTVTANNGTLTVTAIPLVVTPADAGRTYGAANPAFSGTITGIQGSDSITATYSTAATTASDPGSYAIGAQLSDPQNKLGNYSVTLNNGTLTIARANQTINWAAPAAISYGTAISAAQLNAGVSVPGPAAAGAVTYAPAAGTVLDAGVQSLTVNVGGTTDYNPASATVQLTVNKAQPVFSGLKDASLVYHAGSVSFSGALTAPTAIPAGQQVAITLNNVTQNAIVASNGSFTTTFNTAALPTSANGYAINYSFAGSNDFASASATSRLTVAYAVCDLYNTAQAKQSGSTYPITVAVCDANGQNVNAAGMVLTAVGWGVSSPTFSPVPDAGNSNGNGTFRNTGGSFMWNLKTTGMASGNYNVFFTISGDPTLHFAPFAVR
jgi:sugar lactone lactonase YvrE